MHSFKNKLNISSDELWAFQYFDDEGNCVMVGISRAGRPIPCSLFETDCYKAKIIVFSCN